MRNATHPEFVPRTRPVEWKVRVDAETVVTFESLSAMNRWFASHPEHDPMFIPIMRNGRQFAFPLALAATLW